MPPKIKAEQLIHPCVDCGQLTEWFCDWCEAESRIPSESWIPGQMTPLCPDCHHCWKWCRFCREELAQCHFCREERGGIRNWSTKGKQKGKQIGKWMQARRDGKPSDGNGEGGKGEVRGGGKSTHDW